LLPLLGNKVERFFDIVADVWTGLYGTKELRLRHSARCTPSCAGCSAGFFSSSDRVCQSQRLTRFFFVFQKRRQLNTEQYRTAKSNIAPLQGRHVVNGEIL